MADKKKKIPRVQRAQFPKDATADQILTGEGVDAEHRERRSADQKGVVFPVDHHLGVDRLREHTLVAEAVLLEQVHETRGRVVEDVGFDGARAEDGDRFAARRDRRAAADLVGGDGAGGRRASRLLVEPVVDGLGVVTDDEVLAGGQRRERRGGRDRDGVPG